MQNNGFKIVGVVNPAAIVDNGSFTASIIDSLGFNRALVVCHFGATDIAMAALKLQAGAASNGSDAADVTGLTHADALPSATDDNKLFAFDVDLTGLERYLKLVATAGDGTAGTYMSAFVILYNPNIVPVTTLARGFTALAVRT